MGVLPTRTVSVDRSAFAVRHFPAVWVSGLFWNLTRWGVAFLGTFLVNDLTGSPRLVQLAGAILYAPLLFGGLAGGLLSDRLDRLRTVRVQLVALIPISILLGLAVRAEVVAVWMVYLYMFVFGIGWVTDMTSRRALVYDLVGEARLDHAMAMEAISLSSGMILGALVGGTAVDAVGVGSAYFCIAGLLAVAVLALVGVRAPTPTRTVAGPGDSSAEVRGSARAEFGQAIDLCRTQPGMLSLLGVTVIVNFFLFAYLPIVPVVAERLGAGPSRVGLLAAGTGMGMMIASFWFARLAPVRRGAVHVAGVSVAMVFIVPFALAQSYWLALAMVVCSGLGSGLFAATQSSLVMAAAPAAVRGRALGLLSMAIGALPVGMYSLGELAEQTSVRFALSANVLAGLILLVGWVFWRPEVRAMTAETS